MPAPSSSTTPATPDWDAIGELKQAVDAIPVLGNGDIWEAADAVGMMRAHRLRRCGGRSRLPRSPVVVR